MKTGYCIDYSYYQKKSVQISRGIDYLRLSLPYRLDLFKSMWIILDDDNSNFAVIKILDYDITIKKVLVPRVWVWYEAFIDYTGVSTPLFIIVYQKLRTLVDFYGSCFRLIDIDYLPLDFVSKVSNYLDILPSASITRIDYRIDYFSNLDMKVPTPYTILKHNFNSSLYRDYKKGRTREDWSIWDKRSKSVFFRLYNKLLDSDIKWKEYLYTDYFRFNSVHRLEFQCGIKFCKWYTLETLEDLISKIFGVFGLDNCKWQDKILYRYDKKKLVYTREEIARYHSWLYKNVSFLVSNYIKSDYRLELNPLDILYSYINKFNSSNKDLSISIWKDFIDTWSKLL